MKNFPKWLLALAGLGLLPVLVCPLFLFGLQPFGTSDSGFVRLLLYVLTQLLWIVPALFFFLSLELYDRCFVIPSVFVAVLALLITIADACLIFC